MKFAYRLFLMMAMMVSAASATPPAWVKLDFPLSGQEVGLRTCFAGRMSDPNAKVVLVIKPLDIASYYVEPNVASRSDGTFFVVAYVAEAGRQFIGKRFVARAYENPRLTLHESDELDDWPSGYDARSDLVEFTRSGEERTDCPQHTASLPPIRPAHLRDSGAVVAGSAHRAEAGSGGSSAPDSQRPWVKWALRGLCAFLSLLVLMFVVVSEYREKVLGPLKLAIVTLCGWLRGWCGKAKTSVDARNESTANAVAAWKLPKPGLTARQYVRQTMRGPLMFACFVAAFYSEARAISPGLKLLFPPIVADGDLFGGGAAGAALAAAGQHWYVIPMLVVRPFLELWHDDPWALALALIQAAVGCCIFERIEPWAMIYSPRMFLKARPTAFPLFLLLAITLAMIAFNRGHEMTITGNWQLPAAAAGLLALAMPFATSFTLNAAIEAFTKVIAPIPAFVGAGLAFFGRIALPAVGTRLWVAFWLPLIAGGLLTGTAVCGLLFLSVHFTGMIEALCARVSRGLRRTRGNEPGRQADRGWMQNPETSFGD